VLRYSGFTEFLPLQGKKFHLAWWLCLFVCLLSLHQVKNEAVALVDVVAPPDHILGSPIGHSNGKVGLQVKVERELEF